MIATQSVFDQTAWAAIVGRDVAEHTRPIEMRDGLIVIEADGSAWAQQVAFLCDSIVRHTQVQRIKIRVSTSPNDAEGEAA